MKEEKKEEFSLMKFVPDDSARKIFAKVFDRQTIESVHALASKGYFDVLEFVISTGKEAHVFRARDRTGNFRAVKIYKIETTDFKRMSQYIEGDVRFGRVKKTRRSLVYAWTKKEFKNLLLLHKIGVRAPLPLAFQNNVLVMEFVGKKGEASPRLKEKPLEDVEKLHSTLVDFLAKMLFKAELIHSDISEYNILNKNGELVVIDCAQAVLNSHPEAKSFFERDITNISNYLRKKGLKITKESLMDEIKAKKALFKK
ncbi:MAG: serine/threonine protein kinase [Candidatus Diapherotrites archaeon]|uniref:non-specific serine/threonine protein kinase n=1 Tax=Candidatus Iainarchaeum sp. TaxID=3101447 RepID=A0A2D6M1D7_9ARCH|nr:serine/threonine protein kinase [Candidatus Diapherotrites archaeon]|tara:strand:+ start:144 stop:911 length:768 start_codon:yes stop_codon:yes gene_type:complete